MRKHGDIINGPTKASLILYIVYFVARLIAFFCISFSFSPIQETFMKTIADDILLCSTVIFQYMMFRLKKIEILLNPLFSEPEQIQ